MIMQPPQAATIEHMCTYPPWSRSDGYQLWQIHKLEDEFLPRCGHRRSQRNWHFVQCPLIDGYLRRSIGGFKRCDILRTWSVCREGTHGRQTVVGFVSFHNIPCCLFSKSFRCTFGFMLRYLMQHNG